MVYDQFASMLSVVVVAVCLVFLCLCVFMFLLFFVFVCFVSDVVDWLCLASVPTC